MKQRCSQASSWSLGSSLVMPSRASVSCYGPQRFTCRHSSSGITAWRGMALAGVVSSVPSRLTSEQDRIASIACKTAEALCPDFASDPQLLSRKRWLLQDWACETAPAMFEEDQVGLKQCLWRPPRRRRRELSIQHGLEPVAACVSTAVSC